MEGTFEDEFGRAPARVENESFRPSLSPTGDVFDDRKIDITSAIVAGFKTEQLTADQNSAGEGISREKELDSDEMDLEPTEATENPLQSNTVTTKSADDDNGDENPVESESSSATTVEVKAETTPVQSTVIKDKQALIDDDEEELATANGVPSTFEVLEVDQTRRKSVTSQRGLYGKFLKLKNMLKYGTGILICVILPMTVYVIDILVTVNVIESKDYKQALNHWQDDTNSDNKPIPTMNATGYNEYKLKETWFYELLEQSKKHTKRIIDEQAEAHGFKDIMHGPKIRPVTPKKPRTTKATTTKPPEESKEKSEDEVEDESNETEGEESENDVRRRREDEEVSEDEIEDETETETEAEDEAEGEEKSDDESEDKDKKKPKPKKPKPTMSPEAKEKLEKERLAREAKYKEYLQWRAVYLKKDLPKKFNWGNQTVHRFRIKDSNETKEIPYHCQSLDYFYDQHNMRAEKFSEGWFEYKSNKVAQLQQILFIIFTIIGFILCILSIALRADMWFKDEWSSFILGTFVPYIISSCLAAVIYLHESGHGGLRCFACRLSSRCDDIDPGLNAPSPSFPNGFKWINLLVCSYVLKLIDCVIIGSTTLTFVMSKHDAIWQSILKVIGWVIVFPWLVATPLLGIYRFMVIDAILPAENLEMMTTLTTGFFYTGAALWGVLIIAGPIFCKYRMCNTEENPLEKDDF